AAQRARAAYWRARLPLRGPAPRPAAAPLAGPAPSTATTVDGAEAEGPGALQFRYNDRLLISTGLVSSTNEPSVAMSGRIRFQTGNWHASFSNDGALRWTHLSAATAFPEIDGGFCCNQDTLYVPSRSMFVWVLQYFKNGATADSTGGIRIAIFNGLGDISGAGWLSYVFHPSDLGGPAAGEWFDDPHIAVGHDYFYLAINVFTTATDTWTRTIFARMDLDLMRLGLPVAAQFISSTNLFNFTPVQGAKGAMYFASHVSGSLMRILRWPENTTTITAFDRSVAAWLVGGVHNCPGPDGNNWCGFADNRILAGALGWKGLTRQQELWFFWNVREGGGFPLPYIDAARFRESDLVYVRRPFVWSPTTTYHYIGAASNQKGDLGISLAFGDSTTTHVSSMVCAEDDYSSDPPAWTSCLTSRLGSSGPANQRYGDYLRARPAYPTDGSWVATGYTLGLSGIASPRHIVFGRGRDERELRRWDSR
ncbi:MAG: hypothetical protein ACRED5_04965, partial [Propylenella sp.]